MDYRGSCHCGAIGFVYSTAIGPDRWSVRACQCSFCRAHDALSTSDPDGEIAFTVTSPEFLQLYRFGLGTADFVLCRRCGVYIGACVDSDFGRFAIINTRALTDAPANLAAAEAISYDAENTEGRISRRGERWTPVRRLPW